VPTNFDEVLAAQDLRELFSRYAPNCPLDERETLISHLVRLLARGDVLGDPEHGSPSESDS
jgi:hypothetical protein